MMKVQLSIAATAFFLVMGVAHSQEATQEQDAPEQVEELAPEETEELVPEPAAPAPQGKLVGEVIATQGLVIAADAEGNPRELTVGSAVYEDEDIISDEGSKAQILLSDDTLIAVAENTSFSVADFVYNKAPGDQINLEMVLGTIRMLSGEIDKSEDRSIKVLTADAEITALGTTATITSEPDGTSAAAWRDSIRIDNAQGSVLLGKLGNYNFSFIAADTTAAPSGRLSQPAALAALERTGLGDTSFPIVSTVSTALLEKFAVKLLSHTDVHNMRLKTRVGGFWADRVMIKLEDRQRDRHSDGIDCKCNK